MPCFIGEDDGFGILIPPHFAKCGGMNVVKSAAGNALLAAVERKYARVPKKKYACVSQKARHKFRAQTNTKGESL